MKDDHSRESAEFEEATADAGAPAAADDPKNTETPGGWGHIWQMPVLIVGVLLLAVGIWMAVPQRETDDFPGALVALEQYLAAQNFAEARAQLNRISLHLSRASQADQGRLARLNGDLIFLEQMAQGGNLAENHLKVISLYTAARGLGEPFDALHLKRWAQTLIALGRDDEALALIQTLKDEPAERRYTLIRQIIERRMMDTTAGTLAGVQDIMQLLARFQEEVRQETDLKRSHDELLWATDTTARLLVERGNPDQAIDYLQLKIARFRDMGQDADLGLLMVRLARAYQRVGRNDDAEHWYQQAQQKLEKNDPLNAEALVGLAQIAIADRGDTQAALSYFARVEVEFPSTPAYFEALVGKADCLARLGSHAEAVAAFARAVKLLLDLHSGDSDRIDWLTTVVRSHYELNFGNDDFDRALDYLTLLRPLYPRRLPSDLLAEFAVTHERLAGARLRRGHDLSAGGTFDDETRQLQAEARRVANQEAAMHFKLAADHYLLHARMVTISDNEAHGMSLWKAAGNYDQAQLWSDAIAVYSEYVSTRPEDDFRQLESRRRLGMAYLADKQYRAAAGQFEMLIEHHANTAAAQASLVPLARAYMATDEFDRARRVLENVVTDHPAITPDARDYQEALVELGRLHYLRRDFPEAIRRLDQAVVRMGDAPSGAVHRFRLADAYRQSVEELNKFAAEAPTEARRRAIQQERNERLEKAEALFSRVINQLESVPVDTLTSLEQVFLRNAYFYRADCAYDAGRHKQAIALYDVAAKRWEHHPASLVALVQIVNAHCVLGEYQEARVANDRARFQLRRIPDEAFDDPSLPMSRQHWEDWLRWTSELNLFDSQANAAKVR